MFEVPAETVRLVIFPPVRSRVAPVVVAPTTPPEILVVPAVTARLVRLPADTFRMLAEVVAPTCPPVILEIPADWTSSDVRLARLFRVPFTVVAPAEPPVRFAVPAVIVRTPSEAFAVRLPEPLIVVVPTTIPPLLMVAMPLEMFAKPLILATLVTVPPDMVKLDTVPPVRFASP